MRIEQPYRRKCAARFEIAAPPESVFSLMCPAREYEWEPGWTTNLILSKSGLVEQDCIFTTPGGASDYSANACSEAIWTTPIYDPESKKLTMIKVTPGDVVTRLDISVEGGDAAAVVSASYEHTALSPVGCKTVDQHTDEEFSQMMLRWSAALARALGAQKI